MQRAQCNNCAINYHNKGELGWSLVYHGSLEAYGNQALGVR